MSLARIYTTKGPVRKDGLRCGNCGDPIRKGIDRRRTFAVGFRGFEQTRCMKPECTPTRSELESSMVGEVYAEIDGIGWESCATKEELDDAVQQVADACTIVASEYESNEMYDVNEDLQERVSILEAAASELESWDDGLDEEPQEDDQETWSGYETFNDAHTEWLEAARDAARSAVDEVELP